MDSGARGSGLHAAFASCFPDIKVKEQTMENLMRYDTFYPNRRWPCWIISLSYILFFLINAALQCVPFEVYSRHEFTVCLYAKLAGCVHGPRGAGMRCLSWLRTLSSWPLVARVQLRRFMSHCPLCSKEKRFTVDFKHTLFVLQCCFCLTWYFIGGHSFKKKKSNEECFPIFRKLRNA